MAYSYLSQFPYIVIEDCQDPDNPVLCSDLAEVAKAAEGILRAHRNSAVLCFRITPTNRFTARTSFEVVEEVIEPNADAERK